MTSSVEIIAITETGSHASIYDGELVPAGYQILRCDRSDGRKQGGAMLLTTPRYTLKSVNLPNLDVSIDNSVFEIVCASICQSDRFLFTICVVYIPPSSSDSEYHKLFKLIEHYSDSQKNFIVIGDFNLYSCSTEIRNYFEFLSNYCGFITR